MGIGYTLETPLKVSHYGMASAISLVDDILLEKLRKFYSDKFELPYQEITEKMEDFRARRITSYLNLVQDLAKKNFEDFKNTTLDKAKEIRDYLHMLPEGTTVRSEFEAIKDKFLNTSEIVHWIQDKLSMGSIDVNIMTKVDKINYKDGQQMDALYNDAHAAVRGYAQSNLASGLVLSAGMNPRLYGYLGEFADFYPNAAGEIKKKIILKVSDYRSALIQGKFLAKKGLWISEYRIESGLNCGGHAFATDGFLMGPVLAEFKEKRQELIDSIYPILTAGLKAKDLTIPNETLPLKITAQGGVGTAEEHQFLIKEYQLDSVGWGTPFLLVPEATTVDTDTMERLIAAKEDDLYLSNISPLGVPFNNLRGNTKDQYRDSLIEKGRPGSSCPKKYVSINNEFTDQNICTASRQYQHLKLKELDKQELTSENHKLQKDAIMEKSCICVGLGTGTLLSLGIDSKKEGPGVSVCPGPNMAYFSKSMSLKEITDHIYGRTTTLNRQDRPHMFIKELSIYMDYFKKKIAETSFPANPKQLKYLSTFRNNLQEGVHYYKTLFADLKNNFSDSKDKLFAELETNLKNLDLLHLKISELTEEKDKTE